MVASLSLVLRGFLLPRIGEALRIPERKPAVELQKRTVMAGGDQFRSNSGPGELP